MGFRRLEHYARRPHLEFYRRYPNPFYATTFELDATALRRALVAARASTFAGFCWALHRAALQIEAFRVRLRGEEVVLYDTLRLGLTTPGPERTFSFVQLDWDADAGEFLRAAAAATARAAQEVRLTGGDAPDFAYYTALPKLPFTGFTHAPLPDPTAGQPLVAFGRFREEAGRVLVPVAVQVNHLYVHGNDLGELYEAASESFARGLS
jgi:chloramphenicol O-acetyltransferase type A